MVLMPSSYVLIHCNGVKIWLSSAGWVGWDPNHKPVYTSKLEKGTEEAGTVSKDMYERRRQELACDKQMTTKLLLKNLQ